MTLASPQSARLSGRKLPRSPTLTERDRRILLLLGEYGCVSAERIKAHFWNENPRSRAHYRRLGVLKRLLLIENVKGDGAVTIGYRLTKKGKELFSGMFDHRESSLMRRGYKTQFEHDQLLIDVRQVLQKSPLIRNFQTEVEVRKKMMSMQTLKRHWEEMPTIPDALFSFEVPGQKMTVAVELELTPKLRSRYTRIFRNHLLSKDWQLVIYIVKDTKFQDRLMKLLSEIKATDIHVKIANTINGIYFCSLEDFLTKKLEAPMTNGKREISLERIAQNFLAKR